MEKSPSWEANRFSASQEIPRILWNPNVHHSIHKCPLPVPINELDPVHTLTSHFLKIHFNIIFPSTPESPMWPLSLMFSYQNPVYASLLPHTSFMPRPSHSYRFYHLNSIVWGVQIVKFLLCSFLYSIVTSSLLGPKIFSSTPYSRTPPAYVPPSVWATKFHTHTKQQAKLYFCIS